MTEGGIDELVRVAKQLLTQPELDDSKAPSDLAWVHDHYDWLCGKHGGQWVAFLDAEQATEIGVDDEARGTRAVIARNSEGELTQLLADKLTDPDRFPQVVWVPND